MNNPVQVYLGLTALNLSRVKLIISMFEKVLSPVQIWRLIVPVIFTMFLVKIRPFSETTVFSVIFWNNMIILFIFMSNVNNRSCPRWWTVETDLILEQTRTGLMNKISSVNTNGWKWRDIFSNKHCRDDSCLMKNESCDVPEIYIFRY